MITFAQPVWILIGTGICIASGFLLIKLKNQRTALLAQFASRELLGKLTRNVSKQRRLLKNSLFLAAIFCCFIALARPQYGSKWIDVKRKGIDILFAIDTSKSMLTQDIKPNRLERAKFGIMDFVNQLDGDRVGLLPYAGSAFLMCPLTMDYNAFEQSLNTVDTSIIPRGGTDIGTAISEAETVLSNQANHKILILVTDGENLSGDAIKAATQAHENQMTIFTVGVGTPEGELIPDSSTTGSTYKKDTEGKFVTSKLDETTLQRIAETSGGIYAPLGNKGQGLTTIYQKKLSLVPKEELAEKRTKVPLDRFEWPLLAAFLLLLIEFLVSGRRATISLKLPFIKSSNRRVRKMVIKALLIFACLVSFAAPSSSYASFGEEAYRSGDYIGASQYYSKRLEQDPDNPKLHFNYGTAAYKNNLFDDAIASFNHALKTEDLDLQAKAYYNRGNAQYRKGAETVQTDPQHTIKTWQSAIDSYDAGLALNKNDQNGQLNRTLVTKQLEELKKQQQDKQDSEQDKDKNQEQKKDEKNSSSKDEDQTSETNKQDTNSQKSGEKNKETKGQKQKQKAQHGQQKEKNTEEKGSTGQMKTPEEKDKDEKSQIAEADAQRRKLGKMTKEEAEQLLQGLKDEEKELNFVPSPPGGGESEPKRDW